MPEPEPLPWWQQLPHWDDYLRYLIGSLLVLVILWVGVRPLVAYLTSAGRGQENSGYPAVAQADEQEAGETVEVTSSEGQNIEGTRPAAAIGRDPSGTANDIALSLPPPGSELDVQLEHLRLLADKETNRVVEVIKTWVQSNGRTAS